MKVAVNLRPPNGSEKTLVYGAKNVAEAVHRVRKEHPTWDVVRVSVNGKETT